jgi:hypothetical protein
VKITKKQIRKLIIKEFKLLNEETALSLATPAEVVVPSDVTTPEGVAEHMQIIHTEIAQLKTAIANLQGKVS